MKRFTSLVLTFFLLTSGPAFCADSIFRPKRTLLEENFIIIGLTAALGLYGLWWLWWRLPKRQVDHLALKLRDQKARADVEDNLRKTIGQAFAGAAVLVGAGSALFQFFQQQQTAHDLQRSN